MLPIAFNQNLCQHGSNFIRFPMELNGKYCYSTTIYAILKGSGYELSWSPLLASLEITFLQKKRSKSQCESCGLNEEDSSQFLQTLKRYYSRASHLRIHGVRSVHTHDDMGAHY